MIDFTRRNYEEILKGALAQVPDNVDKREGSIIYDALAPACYQLASFYLDLKEVLEATAIETSYGVYLEHKVAEQGLKRILATKAIKKGYFTSREGVAVLATGSRFSTINHHGLNYTVIGPYQLHGKDVPGTYLLECESVGSIGNRYTGDLLPITHITLETATLQDLVIAARDDETDDELRSRYFLAVNQKPFGGNIAQYRKEIKEIDGVGGVQIYPVWNGGGTVKCSVISTEYLRVSSDLLHLIQEAIDPVEATTIGLGLAPIGHQVTICTPTEKIVNITCNITVMLGYTIQQLNATIISKINEYLESLRETWDRGDMLNRYKLTVYVSQISAKILFVPGVANVSEVMINGSTNDLELREDSVIQEIPVLGSVTYEN